MRNASRLAEALDGLIVRFTRLAAYVPANDGYRPAMLPSPKIVEAVAEHLAAVGDVSGAATLRDAWEQVNSAIFYWGPVKALGADFPPLSEKEHQQQLQAVVGQIVRLLERVKVATSKQRKSKRRPSKSRKPRPLTTRQTEAVQMAGECKGNIAQAAKRLGKDRKTVEEAYKTGLAKLGKESVKHGTRTFARDRRGQVDLLEGDDRRG